MSDETQPAKPNEESSEDKAKKFVGGMVLEWLRKWGIAAGIVWLGLGKPGMDKAGGDALPRAEFQVYSEMHEKWDTSVKDDLYRELTSMNGKLDRISERLDRALDKKLAVNVPAVFRFPDLPDNGPQIFRGTLGQLTTNDASSAFRP